MDLVFLHGPPAAGKLTTARALERRIDRPDRREFHKVTDVAFLRRVADGPPVEQPPADLEIDTEHSDPDASAATIVAHFGLSEQPSESRYPTP